jgi:hypothetical protein
MMGWLRKFFEMVMGVVRMFLYIVIPVQEHACDTLHNAA